MTELVLDSGSGEGVAASAPNLSENLRDPTQCSGTGDGRTRATLVEKHLAFRPRCLNPTQSPDSEGVGHLLPTLSVDRALSVVRPALDSFPS
jgi:hypothetical protein